ncbi:MAG: sigma-70 family RNA polymerase sigma factor [Vulcanimicrobiaceae bacterium]
MTLHSIGQSRIKTSSEIEDASIARDFSERRPEALAAAYRAYSQLLYSIARNVLGNDEDAEDCVHDALTRVWRHGFSYRTERGTLKSYLSVCVRNEAISRRRSDTRHSQIERDAFLDTPQSYEIEVVDHAQRASLRQALESLPDEQRQVIELSYFRNLTQTQISDRLGVPLGTIKSRVGLAMQRLKNALRAVSA